MTLATLLFLIAIGLFVTSIVLIFRYENWGIELPAILVCVATFAYIAIYALPPAVFRAVNRHTVPRFPNLKDVKWEKDKDEILFPELHEEGAKWILSQAKDGTNGEFVRGGKHSLPGASQAYVFIQYLDGSTTDVTRLEKQK